MAPHSISPSAITTPFALILHELATNATKYGSWSAGGHVSVSWERMNGTLKVIWEETGGPSVKPPLRKGLGTTLIKAALTGATVDYDLALMERYAGSRSPRKPDVGPAAGSPMPRWRR